MGYSQKNSKGREYFLHMMERSGGRKVYFFSKDPKDSIDLPENLEVFEGPTGMLMVRKKK